MGERRLRERKDSRDVRIQQQARLPVREPAGRPRACPRIRATRGAAPSARGGRRTPPLLQRGRRGAARFHARRRGGSRHPGAGHLRYTAMGGGGGGGGGACPLQGGHLLRLLLKVPRQERCVDSRTDAPPRRDHQQAPRQARAMPAHLRHDARGEGACRVLGDQAGRRLGLLPCWLARLRGARHHVVAAAFGRPSRRRRVRVRPIRSHARGQDSGARDRAHGGATRSTAA
mmetsp:Transcript_25071/g.58447  ORF Transcript_25071/g.58447 Transcript_25071/m.58447 type:complete len:230 (+) Transcript_25071:595-1284(+)